MRGLHLLLLILLALACTAQSFTQFHYDMGSGLPDNNVTAVVHDSRGFVWFSTHAGLSRFDGVNIRNYYSTSEIPLRPCLRGVIVETDPGHLAMICDGRLIGMNTITHQFYQVPNFANRPVYDLQRTSNGQYLVASMDTCFITNRDFEIIKTIVPPARSEQKPVHGFELEGGKYLVRSHLGFYLYNSNQEVIRPIDMEDGPTIMDYAGFRCYDSLNQWLYFIKYFNGVDRYSLQGRKLKHWDITGFDLLSPMNDQFLWIGSSAGFSSRILNLKNDKFTSLEVSNRPLYKAYQFYKNPFNNYWLATDIGVTRLLRNDQRIKSWKTFEHVTANRESYPLQIVKGKDQRIYLSIFSAPFLYEFDEETDGWRFVNRLIAGVWSSDKIGDDLIFTGGGTMRYSLYNPISGSLRHSTEWLKPYFPDADVLILAFQHSNGDQWYSANKGGGFVRIDAKDKSIHHYTKEGSRGHFAWSYYSTYAEDDSGDLWFGVNKTHLLLRWSKKTDTFKEVHLDTIPGLQGKIQSGINRLIFDDRNTLWIGFDGYGVVRYDHARNHAVRYGSEDGLSSGVINSMAFDKHGRLWMGTPNGLNCLLVTENKIRTFNKMDGLMDDEFRDRCLFYDSAENNLWLGTTSVIMRFDTDSLLAQPRQEVKVYLDEIHVNSKRLVHDPQEELRLSFEQNNIHFRFVAVNLNKRPLQLSYRLEGQDIDWVSSYSGTTATYANLDPGTYTFAVRAQEIGNLNDPLFSRPFTFVVATPWFMTWWFRLFAVFGGVLSIVLVIRSYYSRKTEKQRLILEKDRAVEKERTRIATDMHDDFGAGLSRIKFISEKIKLKTDSESQFSDLSRISDYSDEMAEKMNEIVWALNERNDSLEDLVSFTRAYVADYLQHHSIALDFISDIDKNQQVKGEIRRNVFLVIKESLHNIVKHAEATQVRVRFQLRSQLSVTIQDNGRGFSQDEIRPFANGLNNMRKRMEDIGGSLEISNIDGTTILLTVQI